LLPWRWWQHVLQNIGQLHGFIVLKTVIFIHTDFILKL
jgi:hypothetical protein